MLTYDVIRTHAARCPLMQPTDAVKLAYQAAFGGGHLIRNEESCRMYLDAEYRATVQSSTAPLCETVAVPDADRPRGIVRVNLAALDAHGITAEQLCRAFILSAEAVLAQTDNEAAFRQSLPLLRRAAEEGAFRFPPRALDAYLEEYLAVPGLPPVSHSETYRNAYNPHYRIVCPDFLPSLP